MFVNYPLRTASSHYFNMSAGLRRTHIRRRAPGEEIFTRRREDVNDLRVLGEETFVVDVARNHSNIARDHRSLIVPDAKIHPPLEHPNNLLVRMLVRRGMCARLHFPPHDHSLLAGNDTPLNFISDALPLQSCKLAEARHHRHDVPSVCRVDNYSGARAP